MSLTSTIAGCSLYVNCPAGNNNNEKNNIDQLAQCPTTQNQILLNTPVTQDSQWVIMGSSSAAGSGASHNNSWAAMLTNQLQKNDITIHNIAKGGHATYQALSQQCQVPSNRFQPDTAHNVDLAIQLQPSFDFDGVHLNDAGHQVIYNHIMSNLENQECIVFESNH